IEVTIYNPALDAPGRPAARTLARAITAALPPGQADPTAGCPAKRAHSTLWPQCAIMPVAFQLSDRTLDPWEGWGMAKPWKNAGPICAAVTVVAAVGLVLGFLTHDLLWPIILLTPAVGYEAYR